MVTLGDLVAWGDPWARVRPDLEWLEEFAKTSRPWIALPYIKRLPRPPAIDGSHFYFDLSRPIVYYRGQRINLNEPLPQAPVQSIKQLQRALAVWRERVERRWPQVLEEYTRLRPLELALRAEGRRQLRLRPSDSEIYDLCNWDNDLEDAFRTMIRWVLNEPHGHTVGNGLAVCCASEIEALEALLAKISPRRWQQIERARRLLAAARPGDRFHLEAIRADRWRLHINDQTWEITAKQAVKVA